MCFTGLPRWLSGKESACKAGDSGLIPGLGRSPGEGKATHSSILACNVPWIEKLDRLPSMWSQRVRHYWVTEHTYTDKNNALKKKCFTNNNSLNTRNSFWGRDYRCPHRWRHWDTQYSSFAQSLTAIKCKAGFRPRQTGARVHASNY